MSTENIIFEMGDMKRADCLKVGQAVQDRLAEIRRTDECCYIVQRILKDGKIRYCTDRPGDGWRQTSATSLDHWSLMVFTSRSCAEFHATALQKDKDRRNAGENYQVVAIEKAELRTLPCWGRLKSRAAFQPEAPKQ